MNSDYQAQNPPEPDPPAGRSDVRVLVGLLLVLVTFGVYLPVWRFGYVSYDDPLYVTGNGHVQAGLSWAGVKWAFTTGYAGNWHPVTWLSHMLDVTLFGAGALGPHVVNVLLHVANTVLVFVLLGRLTGAVWRSALVAALFGLHPLHVESVAWVAERKDLVSALFFLLSLLSYRSYVSHQSQRRRQCYLLSLVFFALGLLSKPMLVTLPLVLLLLDYWPLKRFTIRDLRFTIWPLVREKLPYLALSAGMGVVTMVVQERGGAVQTLARYSVWERLGNAVVSYGRYLGKTVWPVDLAVFYPHPGQWRVWAVLLSGAVIGLMSVWVVWAGRRQGYWVTGWCWYVVMLIPVIGLVQVGDQAMADRYTYLPLIGVFVLVAWGMAELSGHWGWRRGWVGLMGLMAVGGCVLGTHVQLGYWRDDESLFGRALSVTEGNYVAENNYGNALLEKGKVEGGLEHFRKALEIQPDYVDARINLGNGYLQMGQVAEALAEFETALKLQPDSAEAHYNLGSCLLQQKQLDAAIVHFQKAVAIHPDYVMARNNLGNALTEKGQLDAAIIQYRAALEIRPDFVVAHHNLGSLLLRTGQPDEAIAHFRKVVELQPVSANVHNNLGWMLRQTGHLDEAEAELEKALELRPDYPEAHVNLAKTCLLQRKVREAKSHYYAALKLQPEDSDTLSELAWVLATWPEASLRNGDAALELAQKAERLTGGRDPEILRTLAAAQAEAGKYADAAETGRRALRLANLQTSPVPTNALQAEIKKYEAGVPVRDGLQSE